MKYNKYELVHLIAGRAREAEIESRNMLNEITYSQLSRKREKRNFVKEAYNEILEELKNSNETV